ncbi:MAG: transposase [Gaiellaceae bacterium]
MAAGSVVRRARAVLRSILAPAPAHKVAERDSEPRVRRVNERLYRAYLLKEQVRLVFHEPDTAAAVALLDGWLAWARRCRIASFVKLAKTITTHQAGIATLTHRLSNAAPRRSTPPCG